MTTRLAELGLPQQNPGIAVEIWRQTLIQDDAPDPLPRGISALQTDGRVALLEDDPEDFIQAGGPEGDPETMVYPFAVEATEFKIGEMEEAVGLQTSFWFRDNLQERQIGEPSIIDLRWLWLAAVMGNKRLVWKAPALGWPDPPAESNVIVNIEHARQLLQILPSSHGRFTNLESQECFFLAVFEAVYAITLEVCE